MDTILRSEGLIKKYDNRAVVDSLSLDIRKGEIFTSLYGIKGNELKKAIDESLDFVGLLDRKNSFAKTFSGGMKRRLNIACALGHKPELLIFDEPTVGIDPQSRNFILERIKKANENGTSHYIINLTAP